MPSKVLLVANVPETIQQAQEMTPPGFELSVAAPGSAGYAAALAEADCLFGNVEGMDDAFYRAAPRLRLVQLFSAGYDRVDLAAARRAAVLINCSRGPVIDFPALHEALTTGRIAGAGLDVFPTEPPSPSEPVLSLDNVVLTPHLAGSSLETRTKQTRNAFDNALRVARGERPLWVVPELRDMALRAP